MFRTRLTQRIAFAAFILLYLAVSQLHQFHHLGHHQAAAAEVTVELAEGVSAISSYSSHCPGDFSADSQPHQACHCTMTQFTVQRKFESSFLLTAHELSWPAPGESISQFTPRGINPPPRLS